MEANELRPGNLAHASNLYDGYEEDVVIDHTWLHPTNLRYLNPIPLTEEWLLKFGLEKFPEFLECLKGGYSMRTDSNERVCNNSYGIHKPVYIEYVHQLQNLYFALTGEELTTKP